MNKEIEEAIEHLELFKEDLKELEANEDFILQDGMKIDTLQSLETILNYIEDIEQKNKLLSNTTNELIHLHNVTPNSVIREKIEQIKVKGNEAKKTKENVMFYQGYYIALEEILKEGEK